MSTLHAFVPQSDQPKPKWSGWDTAKLVLWKLFSIAVLGVVYVVVVSEGLRYLIAPLGQKLHKIPFPGFSLMANEMSLRKLDLAHCFSLLLAFATYYLLNENIRIALRNDHNCGEGWNPRVYVKFMQTLGIVVVGTDALLFYLAMSQMSGWGGAKFSLTTLLATALWLGVLLFVSHVTVSLERRK